MFLLGTGFAVATLCCSTFGLFATDFGRICCSSLGAIFTYEDSFFCWRFCPADNFSSDGVRFNDMTGFFTAFSLGGGGGGGKFEGDFCLTDSTDFVAVSLSFSLDFSNSYEENPNEIDFFISAVFSQ